MKKERRATPNWYDTRGRPNARTIIIRFAYADADAKPDPRASITFRPRVENGSNGS